MVSIIQLKRIYNNNFSSCKSDFHNCSLDQTNNKYLVSSTKECMNYDLIKRNVFFGRDSICSVDSIAFDEVENAILFIEFKNSSYKSCKDNAVRSGKESFLTNRLVISLLGDNSMNTIKRKYILVLDEQKNSSRFVNYYACMLSNKLGENKMYAFLKENLIDNDCYGNKLFDEVEISSDRKFDDIVKNI